VKRVLVAAALVASSCGSSTVAPPVEVVAGSRPYRDLPVVPPRKVPLELPEQFVVSAPRSKKVRPSRSRSVAPPVGHSQLPTAGGDTRTVSSTAYCLTGTMANGQRVFRGAVAMNGVPMGSRWRVVETGEVYVVADRVGHSSGFDIAMPADCAAAVRYGRRTVTVERV
jgi:3D (Asp-Asp-Asp) domain-containing protein